MCEKDNSLTHSGIKGMKWGQRRFQNEDGSLTPAGRKRYSDDAAKVKSIRKKRVNEMSNQDLKDVNNRLQLENQYRDLASKANVGHRAVKKYIGTAGLIIGVAGATATYMKYGKPIVEKVIKAIGNYVVKDVKF